jgi:hypothetical protein
LIDQKAPLLKNYVGSESLVVPFAHKLSKDKAKYFTRTAPSTLNELKEAVRKEDAHVIYS